MIIVENKTIASIPTLHVVSEQKQNESLPTIFFLHGFTSAKEHNLHIAYLLAQRHFRVILPDALHHGLRQESIDDGERELLFWDIVTSSITEVGKMIAQLIKRGIVQKEQIGISGTSMGAITMYGALMTYPFLRIGASLMGTPFYETFLQDQLHMLEEKGVDLPQQKIKKTWQQIKPYDPTLQLEKLKERKLFIWHGKNDNRVPYVDSKKLYDCLCRLGAQKNVTFIGESAGHRVSRAAVLQLVRWFDTLFYDGEQ